MSDHLLNRSKEVEQGYERHFFNRMSTVNSNFMSISRQSLEKF